MTARSGLLAGECENGHLACPPHPVCIDCGAEQAGTVDLSNRTGEVVTWTTSHATPPGVREPNSLAIVEFTLGDETVRVIGGTIGDVETGHAVQPVHVAELREPGAGIREPASQGWNGYRFESIE